MTPYRPNSTLKPTPFQRKFGGKGLKRTALNKAGKRVKQWTRIRRQLKVRFLKLGITTCELRLPGCRVDDTLGFAHRYKRRFISSLDEAEMKTCVVLCGSCHQVIEISGHDNMKRVVDSLIAKRNNGTRD